MFSVDSGFEVLLEAHDPQGDVIGEAKAGGAVNPATGTLTLKPGRRSRSPKMHMDFEGKFKLKALNPSTFEIYAQLDLATNYAV